MSHTNAILERKANLCHFENEINYYDLKLNSLMRDYRKKEQLSSFIRENRKHNANALAAKINFLKDEIRMQKEEALDVRPKKKVVLSFISLA